MEWGGLCRGARCLVGAVCTSAQSDGVIWGILLGCSPRHGSPVPLQFREPAPHPLRRRPVAYVSRGSACCL